MAATISPPSKNASKPNTTINDLSHDSLIEIFCRLPCKTLFSCKSVSKHWFALVSDPNFHSIYLTHQHTLFQNLQTKAEDPDQQSLPFDALVITPNLPSLQFVGSLEKHLSLSFLDSYFNPTPKLRNDSVVVCSNGLLLCGNSQNGCIYYVCNPLTRDTLVLPAPPSLYDINDGVLLGFMCDPYYHVELEGVSLVTSLRRFSVVRILAFSGMKLYLIVEVFSSETGKWNRLVVSCASKGFEHGFKLSTRVGVEHDGKLYFRGTRTILVYDPYNDPQVASLIDYPNDFGRVYRGSLGVSCGRLQLSELQNDCGRVWELEYFDGRKTEKAAWRLVHEFYLPDIIGPFEQWMPRRNRILFRQMARIIAYHPYVRGNVFLEFGNHILSCNLLTKRYEATKRGGQSLFPCQVIPIVLPWWPTPIPSLPSS